MATTPNKRGHLTKETEQYIQNQAVDEEFLVPLSIPAEYAPPSTEGGDAELKRMTSSEVYLWTDGDLEADGYMYIGKAGIGATEATLVWQLRKFTKTGSLIKQLWADGNSNFDNRWDQRASYTYA